MELPELSAQFTALQPVAGHADEAMGRRCCQLALEALRSGSYGVGAVLQDAHGEILAEGCNQVFAQDYRPAAHAEMQCLDAFEAQHPGYGDRRALTLTVLLEPCPMCLARILLSGIGRLRWLCADPDGGMAQRLRQLPPAWRNLAGLADLRPADVSPPLRAFASQLASRGAAERRRRVMAAIRG